MNVIIETKTQENASRLKTDIIAEVRNEKIETWGYKIILFNNDHCDSIYHDNDQTRYEENKIIHFRFQVLGTTVIVKESWPTGHEPEKDVKHWLWGRFIEMLMINYPTRFYSLNIEW